MSDAKTDPRAGMTQACLESLHRLPNAPGLAVLRVRPADGGAVPAFTAGQHATLAFESGGAVAVRYYSIASAPEQRVAFEFYVVRVEQKGASSADLFDFEPGHPLWFGAPGGGFILARTDREHLALVATGTGLAPYVSILRHLRAEAAAGRPVPAGVSLWHGVRHAADLGYHAEMTALQREAPFPFRYVPTVSRPAESPGFDAGTHSQGRVDRLLLQVLGVEAAGAHLAPSIDVAALMRLLPAGRTGVFLCGNPKMVQAFEASARGSEWHEPLVYEKYW
ncbi:MAG TPA: FAD-binding oxidoreductase [Planctomycetota bacterium]